jgi:tripartite-type tricarboxylate transporter receptor subunit TctC
MTSAIGRERRRLLLQLCAAAAVTCWALLAGHAQAAAADFPNRPIRFLIGAAPDLLPRLVGQRLSEIWTQQVVIDQRPAANGIIAGEIAAKAPPDGYTWLMSSASFVLLGELHPKLSYRLTRDFTPVTLMSTVPWIVVVNPSVPARSLRELVEFARAHPGKLNYANPGTGTSTHLVTEIFRNAAKIDIVDVVFKGVAAAVTDIVSGQVQMGFAIAQSVVPHVQAGKLRALAITSARRSQALPNVPTLVESGFPDIDMVGWNGVHVPAGTPRAVVNRLNADINRVLQAQDLKDRMLATGFELAQTSVDEFDAFVRRDVARYRKVIRESNIRIE